MLARFRADPNKVRVSIRPVGKKWCVTIHGTIDGKPNDLPTTGKTPKATLLEALRRARFYVFDGIVFAEYPHPMKWQDNAP